MNESFTSDHEASIILSLLNDAHALEHCYNEHNKLTHVFQHNTLDVISSLVDRYYTMGWSPDNETEIEQSQSLYHGFSRQNKLQKYRSNNKVLYISGVLFDNITEFSNSTIESSGRFREKFEQRRNELFNIIKQNENIEIELKLHPKYSSQFPEEYVLIGNVELCKIKNLNLKVLNEYKLVYCEYLSTVYIECILNDIPVVCFCDPYAYKAKEDDVIVNQLFEAKIFQKDIYGAVDMMKLSEEDVTSWWLSAKVENAKLNFKQNYVSFGGLIFDQVERR